MGGDFEIRVRLEDCAFLDKMRLLGREYKPLEVVSVVFVFNGT